MMFGVLVQFCLLTEFKYFVTFVDDFSHVTALSNEKSF